ncbi:hypothetical protein BDB00DRAFT_831241, partial [Zychaea mexicana]|uniref:uncharacterized protein n=1 Tax=Zychaea mexicana TaxID=64656 RepID=UPI0022FDCA6C
MTTAASPFSCFLSLLLVLRSSFSIPPFPFRYFLFTLSRRHSTRLVLSFLLVLRSFLFVSAVPFSSPRFPFRHSSKTGLSLSLCFTLL